MSKRSSTTAFSARSKTSVDESRERTRARSEVHLINHGSAVGSESSDVIESRVRAAVADIRAGKNVKKVVKHHAKKGAKDIGKIVLNHGKKLVKNIANDVGNEVHEVARGVAQDAATSAVEAALVAAGIAIVAPEALPVAAAVAI